MVAFENISNKSRKDYKTWNVVKIILSKVLVNMFNTWHKSACLICHMHAIINNVGRRLIHSKKFVC